MTGSTMEITKMKLTRQTPVWDVPSGMGGSFTVTTLDDDGISETVRVRVCYGRFDEQGNFEHWDDWDGYTFQTKRSALQNPRNLGDRRT